MLLEHLAGIQVAQDLSRRCDGSVVAGTLNERASQQWPAANSKQMIRFQMSPSKLTATTRIQQSRLKAQQHGKTEHIRALPWRSWGCRCIVSMKRGDAIASDVDVPLRGRPTDFPFVLVDK